MEGATVNTRTFSATCAGALALFLALLACTSLARAQKLIDKDLPPNHGKNDPYTLGDPEFMKTAGILSHGGFEFGDSNTTETDEFMATSDIRWLETEHFELGFALGPYAVPPKEKKELRLELDRLAQRLQGVTGKEKILDPWLRAHLFAMRLEDMYTNFLALIQTEQSVFPDGSKPWDRTGTYRGEGPHLGQKGKYEVLILPSEAAHVAYLNKNFGLLIKRTQRWNVIHRDTLTITLHVQQGSLKSDVALHSHLAFNTMDNFLTGLEHYTYDSPIWLREGLAHWAERRVSEKFNTFDGAEGSIPETSRKSDWAGATKKVIAGGDAPRMAKLIGMNGFGELTLDDHYAVWSMIDFLYQTQPAGLAQFILALKGRTDEEGKGDGSDMTSIHRNAFKEHLGMSYSEFDTAWAEWALATY